MAAAQWGQDDSWSQPAISREDEQDNGWDLVPDDRQWGSSPSASECPVSNGWAGNSESWHSLGGDGGGRWLSTSSGPTPATAQSSDAWLVEDAKCSGWGDALNMQDVGYVQMEIDEGPSEEQVQGDAESDDGSSCVGAGLANMGNTCFLNSVLQCLTYTQPFANYLKSSQHKATCQVKGFCAVCALEDHVKEVLPSHGKVISPSYLVNNLSCISDSFRPWQQEDAHEYMLYLIAALHNCCVSCGPAANPSTALESSFVSDIFGGRLRSQVKCTSCSHSSYTFDPFLDLSLEIQDCSSVLDALSCFTAVETVEGENTYLCTQCKQEVRASKQLMIDNPPEVLTIQLKRFSASGVFGNKIDNNIGFGLSLDLRPFISEKDSNEQVKEGDYKYTLYAVLVHSGWSTNSGHYYCFARTSPGTWHILNDSRVKRVSEKTVLEQKAYMLFYIRGDMDGCGGLETGAVNQSWERSPIPSTDSCLKSSTMSDVKQTKDDYCADRIASAMCSNPTATSISTQLEVKEVAALSQAMETPCQSKSTCVLKQMDTDDFFKTRIDKHVTTPLTTQQAGNIPPTFMKGGSVAQRRSATDDGPKTEKPRQTNKVGRDSLGEDHPLKTYKSQSPAGGMRTVPDSCSKFHNGMQQSYMRLLTAMPASRRRALLASALPCKEVKMQPSLATDVQAATDRSKVGNKRKLLQEEDASQVKKHQLIVGSRTTKLSEKVVRANRQDCQLVSDFASGGFEDDKLKNNKSSGFQAMDAVGASQHLDDLSMMSNEGNDVATASRREIRSKRRSDHFPNAIGERAYCSTVMRSNSCLPTDFRENEGSNCSISTASKCLVSNGADHLASPATKLELQEKPWTEEYDHIGSQKLQRGVGGKRIIASLVDGQGNSLRNCGNVSRTGGHSKLSRYFLQVASGPGRENIASLK